MARSASPRQAPLPYLTGGLTLGAALVLAAASQVKLQIFESKSTVALGESLRRYTTFNTYPAERGMILTSDGKPLAEDRGGYELTLVYSKLPQSTAFFTDLAAATGIPAIELAQPTPETKTRSWPDAIRPAMISAIRKVRKDWRADGVGIATPKGMRTYPEAEMASGFVGIQREMADAKTGKPILVRTGLEQSFNAQLEGHDGHESGLADKSGVMLPLRSNNDRVERRDGQNVVTTIDKSLQEIASRSIRQAVEVNGATQGIAVAIDPTNGDILAMANWPSFDPSPTSQSAGGVSASAGYNPAFMARFYPGSTFKILTLAKALDTGDMSMHSYVNCPGQIVVGKKIIHCDSHHGNRAHGSVDAVKAIAKSCNVAACTWALRIGRTEFTDYLDKLGLTSKPNLSLPKTVSGSYNVNEPAKQLQLATFGFGQSITVPPVALAGAFATVANDGLRFEPRLVKRVGEQDRPIADPVRVLSPEACRNTTNAMIAVIESDAGTGKTLRIPGYTLAGKTGTAQNQGRGKVREYQSSFVGFVPARNPRAVIFVIVDHPTKGNYYGATVAGPVFKTLAQGVIDRFRIPPGDGSKLPKRNQSESAGKSKDGKGPEVEIAAGKPIAMSALPR